MKRFLLAASAIATLAVPALSSAQPYENQPTRPDRPERPATVVERPVPGRPATVTTEHRAVVVERPVPGHPASGTIMRVDPHAPRYVAPASHPVWTRNPTWWRARPEFRGYAGARPGYWFRPGVGYVRVDQRWYGYGWRVGGYVPAPFRSYYVESPYLYGLGPAPFGYVYVYLGNNIALMSRSTGYIVQVFPNVY